MKKIKITNDYKRLGESTVTMRAPFENHQREK